MLCYIYTLLKGGLYILILPIACLLILSMLYIVTLYSFLVINIIFHKAKQFLKKYKWAKKIFIGIKNVRD